MPTLALISRCSALETRQKWRLSHSFSRTGTWLPYFSKQMLVAGVAVGPLPAAELHEIAAELLLPLVEGAAPHAPAAAERLARMDRRVVDLHRRSVQRASMKSFLGLEGIEARIVDRMMIDLGAAVGHPVDQQLGHARAVLDPDRHGVPEAAHLLALADRGAAVGGHLQQAVEGALLVVAQLGQDRGQLHGPLQRLHHLLDLQVALGGREAGFGLVQKVARVAEARLALFVVAPLDHAAFGGLRVAGVAHVGGVALIAQQRPADVLAGAGELLVGAEPQAADGRPA